MVGLFLGGQGAAAPSAPALIRPCLKYGSIATGDFDALSAQGLFCNRKLAKEAMKPSKLLRHMLTNIPGVKDKPLEFFKRKKRELERQERLQRATTSTNVNFLRTAYLGAHRIANANKTFAIGKELILPASINICREILGKAAAKK